MISKELCSIKVRNRVGSTVHLTSRSLNSTSNVIYAFKCSKCGETDEEIAEKYCGNSACSYKK